VKREQVNILVLRFLVLVSGLWFFSLLPGHQGIRLFVNSDALYLPSLYRDLFVHHSGLKGWHLNSAPTFFPEMFLYFPLMALLKGATLTSLAYGLVQIGLMMLIADRLLLLADAGISSMARYLITFTFMLFPLSSLFGDGLIIPAQLFLSGYHSGSFLVSMLAMIWALEYTKKGGGTRLILIGGITFLAVISDKLFIMSFVAPVLIFSLIQGLRPGKRTRYLMLMPLLVLTTVLALIAFRLIDNSPFIDFIPVRSKMFQFPEIPEAVASLATHFGHVVVNYPVQRWLVLPSLIFLLLAPVYLAMYLKPYWGRKLESAREIFYSLTLFLFLFVLCVLLTPVINGYYRGPSHIRYNFPALIVGSAGLIYMMDRFLAPVAFPSWLKKYATSFCTLLLFMVLLVWGINNEAGEGLRRYVSHYPEPVRILDELKDEHGLKYGLAGYWQAKHSTILSQNELRLYSIRNKTFRPSPFHAHNENWYFDGGKGRHANPVFNFLETSAFNDTEKLTDLFGEHMDTLYQQDDLLVIKVPDFKIDRESGEIHPIVHKNLPFMP